MWMGAWIANGEFVDDVRGAVQRYRTHGSSENSSIAPSPHRGIDGPRYKPSCDSPKDHEEADECLQARMADAAEDMTFLTRVQIAVGIAGLGGLVATLLLTMWAAHSAGKATSIASTAMVISERAYVFVEEFVSETILTPNRDQIAACAIRVRWRNSGNSPTKNLNVRTLTQLTDGPPLPDDFPFRAGPIEKIPTIIEPKGQKFSGSITIPIEIVRDSIAMHRRIYRWGWAEYNDIFERTPTHRTDFCVELKFDGDGQTWIACTPHVWKRHNDFYDLPPKPPPWLRRKNEN